MNLSTSNPNLGGLVIDADFPRPLRCLFEPRRYKILYGGRGAGRSWGVARALLLIGRNRPIRVLCARELQKSIEDSVHKVLSDQIAALGLDGFYTILKHAIIGANGTSFAFEGIKNNTNKIKSYEGLDYCWVEEAVKVTKTSWGILIPTIRKEGSEIWMTFNPELEEDYTYVRFAKDKLLKDMGLGRKESDQAIVVRMTHADNPWFPQVLRAEMQADRVRDYDHYLNIWEGHCIANLEGAVYAKELRRARLENRITRVPYETSVPVDIFADLGRADHTSLWFTQRAAFQWRLIDFYECTGLWWGDIIKEIQKRGYIIGTIFLPHDARSKTIGTKKSVEEQTRQLGFRVSIVPKLSVSDGINAARMIFPNCWFDEDLCEEGLHAMRHYCFDVRSGHLANEPQHNWASDAADAFRYFAVSAKAPRQSAAAGIAARLSPAITRIRELTGGTAGQGWMG